MSNVVNLMGGSPPSALGEPRPELVQLLEKLLEHARSGHLQSFIGSGFTADGCRMAAWCDTHENVYEMMGSLAWIQAEYTARHT